MVEGTFRNVRQFDKFVNGALIVSLINESLSCHIENRRSSCFRSKLVSVGFNLCQTTFVRYFHCGKPRGSMVKRVDETAPGNSTTVSPVVRVRNLRVCDSLHSRCGCCPAMRRRDRPNGRYVDPSST